MILWGGGPAHPPPLVLMKPMPQLLFILFILLAGCASEPGYQSYYVGDGNLQWFVEPVALEARDGQTATVDFTYRRIKGQENFVRVNVTWNYSELPHGIPVAGFEWSGSDGVQATKSSILFHERINHSIRFGGLLKESEFLQLVRRPQATLTIATENGAVHFNTGAAFERVLKNLAVELADEEPVGGQPAS